jgi:hypothetical protein
VFLCMPAFVRLTSSSARKGSWIQNRILLAPDTPSPHGAAWGIETINTSRVFLRVDPGSSIIKGTDAAVCAFLFIGCPLPLKPRA